MIFTSFLANSCVKKMSWTTLCETAFHRKIPKAFRFKKTLNVYTQNHKLFKRNKQHLQQSFYIAYEYYKYNIVISNVF